MNLKKYRSVLENSISLFSLKAIDLALNLWLIPFLILKVGLYNYGLYAFAMALVLFFVNLLNYGFNLNVILLEIFLSNRVQCVIHNGIFLSYKSVVVGNPQGKVRAR